MQRSVRRFLASLVALCSAVASIVFAGSSGVPLSVAVEQTQQAEESAKQANKRSDRYVDMKSDGGRQTEWGARKILIAVGNFAAHHNGAVITCDSTVRYSDSRIECFGNVLINKGTTYVYGDRAEYNGETNEARVFSNIVKVVDKSTVMYTYNFKFNTKTNIGEFSGGGVVYDDGGQLEAERGYYYADTKDVICVDRVEMKNETYQMKSDSVVYNMESNQARFFTETNIWKPEDKEYLYASRGMVDGNIDLYSLTRDGYILTTEQEVWSDSLDYYSERGYALMRGNIQLDDQTQKVIAFGDWGEYWKEPGNAFLTRNPSVVSYDKEQGDSLFLASDSMFLYTKDPVAERLAKAERDSLLADSIQQALKKQQAALRAKTEAMLKQREESKSEKNEQSDTGKTRPDKGKDREAERMARESLQRNNPAKSESSSEQQSTSVGESGAERQSAETSNRNQTDSLHRDSLSMDSLQSDSLKNPLDTMTVKERRAYERAKAKEAKQHIRDSIKKVRRDSLNKKLDEIAERRQAKKTAFLKKMERYDSIRQAKAQQRADKRLRKRMLALERKGIFLKRLADTTIARYMAMMRADSIQIDSLANRMTDSLLAIYFPQPKGTDSLSVATDTVAVDSTYRLILAYRRVRAYRSDFQMVCDSLSASSIDSVIHLHINPVLWNERSQVTSDVMHIYTDSSRVDYAHFEGTPMTIQQIDTVHYNQVTGKEMKSYFRDNEIYRNDVDGNVQTIYFMQEDNSPEVSMMTYIESGSMSAYIENRQVVNITYRTNPTYTFYPMDKIPADRSMRLKGFKWEEKRRPTRDSVFTRQIRESIRESKESMPRPHFPIERALKLRKERLLRMKTWRDRTDTLSLETIEWVESVKN
ncbi:MAG: hypothetical protein IKC42_02430 [Alistipes sp.]|nr:hypothetical protein [Alistipes sp.]